MRARVTRGSCSGLSAAAQTESTDLGRGERELFVVRVAHERSIAVGKIAEPIQRRVHRESKTTRPGHEAPRPLAAVLLRADASAFFMGIVRGAPASVLNSKRVTAMILEPERRRRMGCRRMSNYRPWSKGAARSPRERALSGGALDQARFPGEGARGRRGTP